MDAEGASCYLGPRYAFVPPDPTLPEPWKGLIDGSTGLMYYWNTVTNVTQYEKPTAVQKPMFSMPEQQMRPQQRNGRFQLYHGVNLKQSQSYQVTRDQPMHYMGYQQWPSNMRQPLQRLKQFPQQQDHRAAFPQRENGSRVQNKRSNVNLVQTPPAKEGSLVQNRTLDVNPVQTPPAQNGTLVINQASDVNPVQTPPAKRGPLVQNRPSDVKPVQTLPAQKGPLVQNQASEFNHVQTPPAQKGSLLQNQPFDVNHVQTPPAKKGPLVQNQPLDVNPVNPPPIQNGPPVQNQPSDVNPVQTSPTQNGPLVRNQPSDANPVQTPLPENGPLVQNQPSDANPIQTPPTESGGSQFQMQQPWTCGQSQQSVADCQQHDIPPIGLKTGFEDNSPGRDKNDPSFDAKNGGPDMVPHQSKLAAIPMAKIYPEMNSVDLVHHNVSPALPGGPNTCNMHVQASGGPTLMNNANPAVIVSPDAMTLSSVDIYPKKHDITAMGDNVPAPFMSFESTGFPPELLREIYAAGFASPTPIQAQTWPIALQNRDIVAIAKTCSGKTLGYLIPAFMLLRRCNNNRQHGPTVIVLAPTKELATQIQNEAIKFGQFVRISCTCLYSGAPEGPQLKDLERGAHIVVASPGRLNDIIEMRKLDFRQVSLLVLDEADRLLDMGYEPQIKKIVKEIPHRRQTLMYTATWTKEVRKLANDLLDTAVQVNIGSKDELAANKSITQVNIGNGDGLSANKSITQVHIGKVDELAAIKSITQYVEVVPHMEKHRRVEQILRSEERGSKTIIFCSTKKCCDQLTYSISGKFGAAAIHGEKSLGQRDSVLNQFHSGKFPVLVVTDVAAPGLDIKDVRVVINYDFPNGVEDYVRRIGLNGRAGTKGVAYTFFSERDWKHAADLIKVLEEANQPVPHEVREIARHGCHGFGKDGGGMCHFVSGHWDCGGRGRGFGFGVMRDDGSRGCGVDSRDGGFGSPGRGNMRGGRFGGRDGGFRGCGGRMDGNFGGRGGVRDSGGGRDGNFGGRGGHKGVGFGGPNGGCDGNDRFEDNRGGGCGHGRGQFDNSRDGDRRRGRSYSRSPIRSQSRTPVRCERSRESRFDDGRDGDLIRGRSYSWSRSRSCRRSGSWSSGRSWSHSRSPRRSRNRSRTPVRHERQCESRFDSKRDGVHSRGRSYSHNRSWSSSRSCSWSRGHSSRRSQSHTPVRRDRRRESRLDNRRDGDRSRGRDRSRSRSLSRSQSRSWSSSRSRSETAVRRERRRESKFDQKEPDVPIPLKT